MTVLRFWKCVRSTAVGGKTPAIFASTSQSEVESGILTLPWGSFWVKRNAHVFSGTVIYPLGFKEDFG